MILSLIGIGCVSAAIGVFWLLLHVKHPTDRKARTLRDVSRRLDGNAPTRPLAGPWDDLGRDSNQNPRRLP
jgi:hypothetical protein